MRISDWSSDVCSSDLAPVERAIGALNPGKALIFLALLGLAFALDGEDALVHLNLDIRGIDAGNIGEDDETLVLFADVDARRPLTGDHVGLITIGFADKAVENLLDFVLELRVCPEGAVANADHQIGRESCRERVCQYV